MSKDGQAVGSNPQQSETTNIEEDDAQWLSETLQMKVDRLVLDYIFGEGTPALAYIKILTARKQNVELDLKIDEFAIRNGHPVSRDQFAERYNRPLPAGEDDVLLSTPAQAEPPQPGTPPNNPDERAANERKQCGCGSFNTLTWPRKFTSGKKMLGHFCKDCLKHFNSEVSLLGANEDQQRAAVVQAFAADLQPIRAELAAILQIADDVLREVKLRAWLQRIEQLKRELPVGSETQREIAKIIGSELAAATTKKPTP